MTPEQLERLVRQQAEALDRTIEAFRVFATQTTETMQHLTHAVAGLETAMRLLVRSRREEEE